MENIAKHYFEAHVTIEPIFDDKLKQASEIAIKHGFKIASLLMQKRSTDTPERSKYDTFMTGHGKEYDRMVGNITALILELNHAGFKVWRYKIEDTIIDSRISDVLGMINETDRQPRSNQPTSQHS